MKEKPILKENTPANELPYRKICHPFRLMFAYPGKGIKMYKDANGVVRIESEGGSVANLEAGNNIALTEDAEGNTVISVVDSITNISGGQNVAVDIDPETGEAVVSFVSDSEFDEHFKGVFETAEDLINAVEPPEQGDFGLVKNITFSDGGSTEWTGSYKYCFFIDGVWKVVDQMLTFTDNEELLSQFFSVGGGSPTIYLHKIARSGDFRELENVPIVATPVLSVSDVIEATCETEGAEIWYTSDGSMPHVNGIKYTGPIHAENGLTYRFVGVKNGMINSLEAEVSFGYSLLPPTVSLDYRYGTVTMENPNPAGQIHYTTDGSTPTEQSTLYQGPFTIDQATTFKLIVIHNGVSSPVTEQSYQKVATPSVELSHNYVSDRRFVKLSCATQNSVIHYTTDGNAPVWSSDDYVYALQFHIYEPSTVKAVAFAPEHVPSFVRTSLSGFEKPSTPVISFDANTRIVTISKTGETQKIADSDAVIYYTTDGTEPSAQNGTQYNGFFQGTLNTTVKAVVVCYGEYTSDVASREVMGLLDPVFKYDHETGYIVIENPNKEGTVFYTTDGTDPTDSSRVYEGPFVYEKTMVVKAVVVSETAKSGEAVFSLDNINYGVSISFSHGDNQPGFDPLTGFYDVTMVCDIPEAEIHYTTDGSEPTAASKLYTGIFSDGIVFTGERTYKAIAFHPGATPSNVATAVYGFDSVDAPDIEINTGDGTANFTLSGNTAEIPLQTNNNIPNIGARIYYTTDGSEPTAENGILWDGTPVSTRRVSTLKAVTVCYVGFDGGWSSDVRTATLSLLLPPTASIDPNTGTVTLENPNQGGTIYYTTDGSEPTAESTPYDGPFVLTDPTTIKMIVIDDNTESDVDSVTYEKATNISINIEHDYDTGNGTVVIENALSGQIHYTTDGSVPTAESPTYSEPIAVGNIFDGIVEYKARSIKPGYIPGEVERVVYGFDSVDAPDIEINTGDGTANFTLSGNTAEIPLQTNNNLPSIGARIYYTTDGSEPTAENGILWDANPVSIEGVSVLKAVTVCYGEYSSDVTTETLASLLAPSSSLDYITGIVTMENPNPSGTIHYTTDGTEPTEESTPYDGPVELTGDTELKMIVVDGEDRSPAVHETYRQLVPNTISPVYFEPDGRPQHGFDRGTGEYYVQMIRRSSTGWLYYTTDGSIPTTDSNYYQTDFYGGNIFDGAVTYKSRVIYPGYIPSQVTTAVIGYDSVDVPEITLDDEYYDQQKVTFRTTGNVWDNAIPVQTTPVDPNIGARIYYTTDGSVPTAENGILWDGDETLVSFDESAPQTVKAVVVCYGQFTSEVAEVPLFWFDKEGLSFVDTDSKNGKVVLNKVGTPKAMAFETCSIDEAGRIFQRWTPMEGGDHGEIVVPNNCTTYIRCVEKSNNGKLSFGENNYYYFSIAEEPMIALSPLLIKGNPQSLTFRRGYDGSAYPETIPDRTFIYLFSEIKTPNGTATPCSAEIKISAREVGVEALRGLFTPKEVWKSSYGVPLLPQTEVNIEFSAATFSPADNTFMRYSCPRKTTIHFESLVLPSETDTSWKKYYWNDGSDRGYSLSEGPLDITIKSLTVAGSSQPRASAFRIFNGTVNEGTEGPGNHYVQSVIRLPQEWYDYAVNPDNRSNLEAVLGTGYGNYVTFDVAQ